MNLSISLPNVLEQNLIAYCHAHSITEEQVIQNALLQFLYQVNSSPTPYELGMDGFGADQIHSGDIAKNSQQLLRERLHAYVKIGCHYTQ